MPAGQSSSERQRRKRTLTPWHNERGRRRANRIVLTLENTNENQCTPPASGWAISALLEAQWPVGLLGQRALICRKRSGPENNTRIATLLKKRQRNAAGNSGGVDMAGRLASGKTAGRGRRQWSGWVRVLQLLLGSLISDKRDRWPRFGMYAKPESGADSRDLEGIDWCGNH